MEESCFVSALLVINMYGKYVRDCGRRGLVSGRSVCGGNGKDQHVAAWLVVRRPPPISVYGLCGEFGVSA